MDRFVQILAALPGDAGGADFWCHETDAWRRHAERLRAVAARHGLTVDQHR